MFCIFFNFIFFPGGSPPGPAFFCLVVVQGNERDTKRNPLAFAPLHAASIVGWFFQGQPKETKRNPILVGPIPEEKNTSHPCRNGPFNGLRETNRVD